MNIFGKGIGNIEPTNWLHCSHSLLTKDYEYIYDVLNRNIGDIDYRQDIKGKSPYVGYAYTINHRQSTVYNFVGDVRKRYVSYFDYAQQNLNQNLYIGNIYDGVLNGEGELILSDRYNKEVVFDNSYTLGESKLTEQSIEYNDLINFVLDNKETNDFVFGKGLYGEIIPHQITKGYNFLYLPNNVRKGISIEYGDVLDFNVNSNFGKYSFDDKVFEEIEKTTYSVTNQFVHDTILKNLEEVSKSNYSYIFQNTNKKPRYINNHFNEEIVSGYDEISRGFNQNLIQKAKLVYAESQYDSIYADNKTVSTSDSFERFGNFYNKSFDDVLLKQNTKDLISFTNNNFKNGRYKTLIARFGSSAEGAVSFANKVGDYSIYNTAISERGMSHGRNLLRKKGSRDVIKYEGYNDPYCRVWTNFHQYNQVKDLIRPFSEIQQNDEAKEITSKELFDKYGFSNIRRFDKEGFINGQERLGSNSVLQNGFVNIAPMFLKDKNEVHELSKVKQCMFSLENLAWKGCTDSLVKEQKGPLGGRIMWFPPYDLKFSESVSVPWNATQFIGRGEKVYTYTDTERSGQLSFKMLIDHPSIVHYFPDTEDNDFNQTGKEYDLLRFFAGCGFPDGMKSKEIDSNSNNTNTKNSKTPIFEVEAPTIIGVEEDKEPLEPLPKYKISEVTDKIIFMVFFPNNYTGAYEKGVVDPITYLLNGIGAQKESKETTVGNKTVKQIKDIPTDDTILSYIGTDEVIGYEINENQSIGISCLIDSGETSGDTEEKIFSGETSSDTEEKIFESITLAPQKNACHPSKYNWWYRVDIRNKNGVKSPDCEWLPVTKDGVTTSYGHKDRKSFGLNRNIETFKDIAEVNYKIASDDFENLYSLTEVFSGLRELNGISNDLTKYYHTPKSEELKAKLEDSSVKIVKVTTEGFASSHGTTKSNEFLMNDRGKTIQNWVRKVLGEKITKDTNFDNIISTIDVNELKTSADYGGKKDESEKIAKLGRCAKCVIEYTREVTEELQDTTTTEFDENGQTTYVHQEEPKPQNGKMLVSEEPITKVIENYTDDGYGEEYKFFKKLTLEDSFLHHKIREKIQYFDPAFHSISPEGFNSRLTFLHQCTRQGPTIGNSNLDENKTANNLAFGRQPVCVLRVGDFYYTKIIIESLNIDYEQQWDLNQEGIGVQPMMANITLSFKFIGGSDLAGPIARLQNAVSFNFYANASVYDSRAEMIEYGDDKTGKPIKYKPFNAGMEMISQPK